MSAWRGMIDNFKDHEALKPGLAPHMLEHQEPRAKNETKPGVVQPDGRTDKPARLGHADGGSGQPAVPRIDHGLLDVPGALGRDLAAGSNSSTTLPAGSSIKICFPPGPVTISLRKRTPSE